MAKEEVLRALAVFLEVGQRVVLSWKQSPSSRARLAATDGIESQCSTHLHPRE